MITIPDTSQIDLELYSWADDEAFAAMAIEERNEILDALHRREQTIEARAEAAR